MKGISVIRLYLLGPAIMILLQLPIRHSFPMRLLHSTSNPKANPTIRAFHEAFSALTTGSNKRHAANKSMRIINTKRHAKYWGWVPLELPSVLGMKSDELANCNFGNWNCH